MTSSSEEMVEENHEAKNKRASWVGSAYEEPHHLPIWFSQPSRTALLSSSLVALVPLIWLSPSVAVTLLEELALALVIFPFEPFHVGCRIRS
jgi:hypothetical protein